MFVLLIWPPKFHRQPTNNSTHWTSRPVSPFNLCLGTWTCWNEKRVKAEFISLQSLQKFNSHQISPPNAKVFDAFSFFCSLIELLPPSQSQQMSRLFKCPLNHSKMLHIQSNKLRLVFIGAKKTNFAGLKLIER